MDLEARRAYQAELDLAVAARAALDNRAVLEYYDAVEKKAIDAMLACGPTEDLERLRLSVVASTIRQMKAFLAQAVAAGDFAAQMLGRTTQQGERDGA